MGLETRRFNLDDLAQLYANRTNQADGYATATHAGVAAVLEAVADHARKRTADAVDVYDNRLMFQFIAELDRVVK